MRWMFKPVFLLCSALCSFALQAQEFPARPLRIIVPYTAGGVTDVVVRHLARAVEPGLGQPVVVENKTGANGTIGAIQLITTPPDGYTLSIVPIGIFRQQERDKSPLDAGKHLTYITSLVDYSYLIAVKGDSPWKSVADLARDVKAGKRCSYATPGVLSTPHLSMEAFLAAAGIQCTHIPYRGSADLPVALMGGQVDVMVSSAASVFDAFVKKGQMRILNMLSDKRAAEYPEVHTLKEDGFPIVAAAPFGLVGPAGMNPRVVARIDEEFRKALHSAEFAKVAASNGVVLNYMGPAEYTEWARKAAVTERESVARWARNNPGAAQ